MRTEGERRPARLPLSVVAALSLVLVVVVMAFRPQGTALELLIRASALLGYIAVFLACLSSAYMRQMARLFGRPYLRLHHALAVSGLVWMTIHAVSVAVRLQTLAAFVPSFASLHEFFLLGGRPAWFLFVAASAAALLRTSLPRTWRVLHALNYVAFWLATAHGILIGTDMGQPVLRAVALIMAIVVLASLVLKRRRGA